MLLGTSDGKLLRRAAIAVGLGWSALFPIIGLWSELQNYADGSMFAYSVAAVDAWAFHWRNISGRIFVYLFFFVPAEAVVGLTGSGSAGIAAYGLLHFGAPALGLVATYAADRSKGRIYFAFACLSTASLCPLVFGFPTEMWAAHALFWPTLALGHHADPGWRGFVLVLAAMLGLILTHEGALVFALAILVTVAMRGWRDDAFRRAWVAFVVALGVWAMVKIAIRPDDYFATIIAAAARNFIDVESFASPIFLVLGGALASYALAAIVLRRAIPGREGLVAALIAAAFLGVYWIEFDDALHASERYPARTALLLGTPILGGLAALLALDAGGRLRLPGPVSPRVIACLGAPAVQRGAIGALALVMLVHTVETANFVAAWIDYKAAVRALAMGVVADPDLGDPRFVSSDRIDADLNRLAWMSTTPYLSVLVAPGYAPLRLVVDPAADNYFWLSCETATRNFESRRTMPLESRRLVRAHACLHRK